MAKTRVTSIRQLVDKLGGPKKAATIFGTTAQNVCHWQANNSIPAKYYGYRTALNERHLDVPLSLWRFEAPQPVEAAE